MSTLVILPGPGATPPAAPVVGLWVGVILETPGIVHGGIKLPTVTGAAVAVGSVAGRTATGSAESSAIAGSVYGRVSTSSVSSDWMVKP